MYKLEFLPIAKQDMDSIIYYISHELKNSSAAKRLANDFIRETNKILDFPYGSAIYHLDQTLQNEYREMKIRNFIMFYTINEKEKIITVVRVLYQKMDISKILK